MSADIPAPDHPDINRQEPLGAGEAPGVPSLPEGVLVVRRGPGANCSSAGSAIDILFYGSVIAGAIAVALAAAFPPRASSEEEDDPKTES